MRWNQCSSSAQVSSHFSGHPGVLPTPISGSPFPRSPMLPPGFCTRRVQRLRKSFSSSCLPFFPGPPTTYAQPTRGPPTLQVQTDVHKKPSGLQGLARCSPTRRLPHLTPGATHTPTLRCQSSPPGRGARPSRASLGSPSPWRAPPGRLASTRPRDSSGSHAPLLSRGGGRGLQPELCSLTVFFLATIFSSFLAIFSSSSSWPMLARDARRG